MCTSHDNQTEQMAMIRYCLECGYSRQGLPQDAVCPECGEADSFDKQREVCVALVNKPLALLWRIMTLRRMPKGWWVVFDKEHQPRFKPWQIFLAGVLISLTFGTLSLFVRIEATTTTYFYDINDPQQSVIDKLGVGTDIKYLTTTETPPAGITMQGITQLAQIKRSNVSTIKTGKKRATKLIFGRDTAEYAPTPSFIGYLIAYTITVWLLIRFVWLPLIARDRSATAFLCAAKQTTVIYTAHVLLLIAVSVMGFIAFLTASLFTIVSMEKWIRVPYLILQLVVLIFGPAVFWARLISTDNLKLEFPRRFSAGILLIGFTILAAFAVFTWPLF